MSSPATKAGAGPKGSHSVRVHDELWAAASRRARSEANTINGVIEEILEGYAKGLINMPKIIKKYK